jgi:hypothetical protein
MVNAFIPSNSPPPAWLNEHCAKKWLLMERTAQASGSSWRIGWKEDQFCRRHWKIGGGLIPPPKKQLNTNIYICVYIMCIYIYNVYIYNVYIYMYIYTYTCIYILSATNVAIIVNLPMYILVYPRMENENDVQKQSMDPSGPQIVMRAPVDLRSCWISIDRQDVWLKIVILQPGWFTSRHWPKSLVPKGHRSWANLGAKTQLLVVLPR